MNSDIGFIQIWMKYEVSNMCQKMWKQSAVCQVHKMEKLLYNSKDDHKGFVKEFGWNTFNWGIKFSLVRRKIDRPKSENSGCSETEDKGLCGRD